MAESVTLLPGIMVSFLVIECAKLNVRTSCQAAAPGSAGLSDFDILAFVVSVSVGV